MAPYSFGNAKASSVLSGETRIETGMIVNVNPVNKTVDWAAHYTGRLLTGIQLGSPYFHYDNGEGFTVVPDLGALCAVCWPTDGEAPFVFSFIAPPEPGMSIASGSPQATDQQISGGYNAGRPMLNPGDMYIQGRDDNFIVLRRGGVLQLGSSSICQRLYIPLNNVIRDVCENWELTSAGGTLAWEILDKERGNPTEWQYGEASPFAQLNLIARARPDDKQASIRVSVGEMVQSSKDKLSDTPFVELIVAPQALNPVSGKLEGTQVFALRIDKAGSSYQVQALNRRVEVGGDDTLVISGGRTTEIGKDDNLTVTGSSNTNITGSHSVTGKQGSTEKWGGGKVISAPTTQIGGEGASHPLPLGDMLFTWLATHTHPCVGQFGFPTPPPPPSILSTKNFIDK
jgi:hypothetical protein